MREGCSCTVGHLGNRGHHHQRDIATAPAALIA
jgi:hypothetical protein